MEYVIMPKADYIDTCNTIRSFIGGNAIKSGSLAENIRFVHTEGYEKGNSQEILKLWDEMLGDNYKEVGGGSDENMHYAPTSVLARGWDTGNWYLLPPELRIESSEVFDIIVIPRSITTIAEGALEECYEGTDGIVICLAETPPTLGWQGMWSYDGGGWPPVAIYVPDLSVDAYKIDTGWAEYSDCIKPLSEFEGGLML